MYHVRCLPNDACNLDLNVPCSTKEEALNYLQLAKKSIETILGPKDFVITKLSENVTVYTLNLKEGTVYIYYLIYEEEANVN